MKILLFGDSITVGTLGGSYADRLQAMLPEHTFVNHGKSGDTVISLHRRLKKMASEGRAEFAVVFIGVNDVFGKLTVPYRMLKLLRGQRWAGTPKRFETTFRHILNGLSDRAERIVTIPPLLLGENPHSRWNRELDALAKTCRSVSSEMEQIEFLDIRAGMLEELSGKTASQYLPKRMLQVAVDKLMLTTDEKIDAVASARGLVFTVDGVHLNTRGSRIVAEAIHAALQQSLK